MSKSEKSHIDNRIRDAIAAGLSNVEKQIRDGILAGLSNLSTQVSGDVSAGVLTGLAEWRKSGNDKLSTKMDDILEGQKNLETAIKKTSYSRTMCAMNTGVDFVAMREALHALGVQRSPADYCFDLLYRFLNDQFVPLFALCSNLCCCHYGQPLDANNVASSVEYFAKLSGNLAPPVSFPRMAAVDDLYKEARSQKRLHVPTSPSKASSTAKVLRTMTEIGTSASVKRKFVPDPDSVPVFEQLKDISSLTPFRASSVSETPIVTYSPIDEQEGPQSLDDINPTSFQAYQQPSIDMSVVYTAPIEQPQSQPYLTEPIEPPPPPPYATETVDMNVVFGRQELATTNNDNNMSFEAISNDILNDLLHEEAQNSFTPT